MDAKDVKVTYEMAKPEDYDEIVDLANFVFSYAHRPHEFKTLIPKAYGPDRTMWPEHFLAPANGLLRATVCTCIRCFWRSNMVFVGSSPIPASVMPRPLSIPCESSKACPNI